METRPAGSGALGSAVAGSTASKKKPARETKQIGVQAHHHQPEGVRYQQHRVKAVLSNHMQKDYTVNCYGELQVAEAVAALAGTDELQFIQGHMPRQVTTTAPITRLRPMLITVTPEDQQQQTYKCEVSTVAEGQSESPSTAKRVPASTSMLYVDITSCTPEAEPIGFVSSYKITELGDDELKQQHEQLQKLGSKELVPGFLHYQGRAGEQLSNTLVTPTPVMTLADQMVIQNSSHDEAQQLLKKNPQALKQPRLDETQQLQMITRLADAIHKLHQLGYGFIHPEKQFQVFSLALNPDTGALTLADLRAIEPLRKETDTRAPRVQSLLEDVPEETTASTETKGAFEQSLKSLTQKTIKALAVRPRGGTTEQESQEQQDVKWLGQLLVLLSGKVPVLYNKLIRIRYEFVGQTIQDSIDQFAVDEILKKTLKGVLDSEAPDWPKVSKQRTPRKAAASLSEISDDRKLPKATSKLTLGQNILVLGSYLLRLTPGNRPTMEQVCKYLREDIPAAQHKRSDRQQTVAGQEGSQTAASTTSRPAKPPKSRSSKKVMNE